jgi:hypothetical protein
LGIWSQTDTKRLKWLLGRFQNRKADLVWNGESSRKSGLHPFQKSVGFELRPEIAHPNAKIGLLIAFVSRTIWKLL